MGHLYLYYNYNIRHLGRLNCKRTKRHLLSFGMLYFQRLCRFLHSPKISDYPHLNITIKFSSTCITEDLSFGKVLSSYCFPFCFKPKWAYKLPRSNVHSVKTMSYLTRSNLITNICVFCKYMLTTTLHILTE